MRQFKKLWMDQEAVSPVIAVILMVAITVVLAAVLYLWAQSFIPTGKSTPTATMTTSMDDGNYVLTVADIGTSAAGSSVEYFVLTSSFQTVERGELDDVYNKVLRNPIDGSILANVSWRDSNQDDKLSANDVIILLGEDNDEWNDQDVEPGMIQAGYIFRLTFGPTGKTIVQVELT
ncbi:MAG: type IV pilin [Thermoplasmata archaeon]|nr:type IV pilin [Thermoplasmata archaeon]